MQVLKEEVKNKILSAAETIFYEKDYRSAKLTEIADRANIPVALIYTYFKNKSVLFDAVVDSVYLDFQSVFREEESLDEGLASERFEQAGEKHLLNLLKDRKKLIIVMDNSSGTKHMEAKQKLIRQMQEHIEIGLQRHTKKKYDSMLTHILANNFTEGFLEIARHYQGETWANNMLKVMTQCYYKGVESL